MTEQQEAVRAVFEPAPAKINLTLHVRRRRDDGFHTIDSLVAFADFGDELEVACSSGFALDVRGPFASGLAGEADNLVEQAAVAVSRAAGLAAPEFSVRLDKKIPVAAGLGGGSADAAAMVRAGLRLARARLGTSALMQIAAALGADVPCCLASTAQWISGVGHELAPAPALPPVVAVLVNPGIEISTAAVFDGLGLAPGSDAEDAGEIVRPDRFQGVPDFIGYLREARNDLEMPAVRLVPEIGDVQDALFAQNGCLLVRMSGSGATCFGLFANHDEAVGAAALIADARPSWWVQLCLLR